MDAEHLEYFKAALEGRASVGWNVWFAAHQQALAAAQLGRRPWLMTDDSQADRPYSGRGGLWDTLPFDSKPMYQLNQSIQGHC